LFHQWLRHLFGEGGSYALSKEDRRMKSEKKEERPAALADGRCKAQEHILAERRKDVPSPAPASAITWDEA
jgi:hypothetical protein